MYPIGVAAVVGLAILIERIVALRAARVIPEGLSIECRDLIDQRRFADAETLCRKSDSPASRLIGLALDNRQRRRSAIKERLEERGRIEAAGLERYTSALGSVAQASPLLGLLGTVLGMIRTFNDIRASGLVQVSDLAGGISEALITTMAGLSVGIPALIAYRWILTVVDDRVLELESLSTVVLDKLDQARPEQAAAEGGE
jgi:biopolymer transport protein ExbB